MLLRARECAKSWDMAVLKKSYDDGDNFELYYANFVLPQREC